MIRLFGSTDLHRTTTAIDDAADRLSRYFLTKFLINAGFGVIVGVGLALIGVPGAILWGVLTALARFIPYIGSFIAAVPPLLLAAALEPGWSMVIWTLILFGVGETVVGQVVEPMMYGRTTGLSPVSVVVGADRAAAVDAADAAVRGAGAACGAAGISRCAARGPAGADAGGEFVSAGSGRRSG
jgi:predicted PurR-regulated permease PerM